MTISSDTKRDKELSKLNFENYNSIYSWIRTSRTEDKLLAAISVGIFNDYRNDDSRPLKLDRSIRAEALSKLRQSFMAGELEKNDHYLYVKNESEKEPHIGDKRKDPYVWIANDNYAMKLFYDGYQYGLAYNEIAFICDLLKRIRNKIWKQRYNLDGIR